MVGESMMTIIALLIAIAFGLAWCLHIFLAYTVPQRALRKPCPAEGGE